MMSKNSFLTDIQENLKRRNWVFWIYFLIFFCYFPGFLMLDLNQIKNRMEYYTAEEIIETLQKSTLILFQPNTMMVFLAVVLGCFAGLQAFAYLHDKKQVNFYHSQPVSRNRRFLALWFNGILIFAVTYLINMVLGMAVAGVYGSMNGAVMAQAWKGMLVHFLIFLSSYHLAIIAVMLTGNMLVSILATGVLFGYELAVRGMYIFMATVFYDTFSYRNGSVIMDTWFSPIMIFVKYISEVGRDGFLYGPSMSYGEMVLEILVLAVLFGVISWLLYGVRASESHGKSISFPQLKEPLRVLLLLVVGTFCGMMIYQVAGESVPFGIAGTVFFTALGHAVIQLVYEVDFRAVTKKLPFMGISVAAAIFCFLIFALDIFGYDSRLPKQSRVDSVSLDINLDSYSNGRVMPDGWEYGRETYALLTMKLTDLDTVYELLGQAKGTPDEAGDSSRNMEVAFYLKNGETEYRDFYVNAEESMEVLDKISRMEEYQTAMNQVLEDNFAEDYKIYEIAYDNGEEQATIPEEKVKALWEAYRKDVKENGFSDTYGKLPVGRLCFNGQGIRSADFTNQWEVNVYPSYKNTIAVLRQENIPVKWEVDEKKLQDIVSIEIIYTDYESIEELWHTESAVTINSYQKKLTYADPAQVKEIMESVVPARVVNWGDYYNNYESDYDIVAFEKDMKDFQYSRHYYDEYYGDYYGWDYFFPVGQVPDFVLEDAKAGLPVQE